MEESRILAILLENYSSDIVRVEFLRESGGTAYIVYGKEQKYFLKIGGKAFLDTIRRSVDVVCYLASLDFPVPAVIRTNSGSMILEIAEDGKEYLFMLYEYIEGKEPDLCVCGGNVGDLVGRLHRSLLAYPGELIERDRRFFIDRYLDILCRKNYPRADVYAELGAALWGRVQDCPMGVCHGDLHRGNLLEGGDGTIWLLDLDTICLAPRMFDVMVMCDMTDYFNLQNEDIQRAKAVYKRFLTGYTPHIDLTETELASFQDWVAIRHFQLQATIVEMFGIDCIDDRFIDQQLKWLEGWMELPPMGP